MQIKAIVYDKTKSFLDQAGVRQFEAERQNIKMPSHSNPIFRQATTTVQNPTYNSPQFYWNFCLPNTVITKYPW